MAINKYKKVLTAIGIIFISCSLLLFIPQMRELIISAAENLLSRQLNHNFWHKKFLKLDFLFISLCCLCLFLYKLYTLLKQNDFTVYGICIKNLKNHNEYQILHLAALAVYIFILCSIHFCLVPSGDDLTYFSHILEEKSLTNFLTFQYHNWSSRSLIEAVLVYCYKLNFGVWRFFDVLAFVVIAEAFIYLCFPGNIKTLLVYPIILCFTDFNALQSAGWGATTVNYLWPLACAMPHLIIVKKIFEQKKLTALNIAISIPFFLFAINQEQMAALLFGLNISFLAFHIIKTKKISYTDIFFIINIILSAISIFYILTCPGNDIRYTTSIKTYFPTYESLSLLDKIQIGLLTILTYYFTLKKNLIIIPLCLFLTLIFYKKKNYNFIIQILMNLFILFCGFYKNHSSFIFSNTKISEFSNFNSMEIFAETIVLIITAILFLVQIYQAFGLNLNSFINIYLLFAGFCSAFITVFSPSIYASGSRCYLFFSTLLLYVSFNLINHYSTAKEGIR